MIDEDFLFWSNNNNNNDKQLKIQHDLIDQIILYIIHALREKDKIKVSICMMLLCLMHNNHLPKRHVYLNLLKYWGWGWDVSMMRIKWKWRGEKIQIPMIRKQINSNKKIDRKFHPFFSLNQKMSIDFNQNTKNNYSEFNSQKSKILKSFFLQFSFFNFNDNNRTKKEIVFFSTLNSVFNHKTKPRIGFHQNHHHHWWSRFSYINYLCVWMAETKFSLISFKGKFQFFFVKLSIIQNMMKDEIILSLAFLISNFISIPVTIHLQLSIGTIQQTNK